MDLDFWDCFGGEKLHLITEEKWYVSLVIDYFRSAELVSKVQENIHKCVIKCLAKDPLIKVRLAAMCVQEDIINFQVLAINPTFTSGLACVNLMTPF